MVELDETQLAIYNYSSEHTLKETCEHFQKRKHQVKYIKYHNNERITMKITIRVS